ncbi:hypothetical protein ONZ45_g10349 [Pleurotus djamor]|nr:hypothetical protein ONZ45_g10349 [Pleurotus djamor]
MSLTSKTRKSDAPLSRTSSSKAGLIGFVVEEIFKLVGTGWFIESGTGNALVVVCTVCKISRSSPSRAAVVITVTDLIPSTFAPSRRRATDPSMRALSNGRRGVDAAVEDGRNFTSRELISIVFRPPGINWVYTLGRAATLCTTENTTGYKRQLPPLSPSTQTCSEQYHHRFCLPSRETTKLRTIDAAKIERAVKLCFYIRHLYDMGYPRAAFEPSVPPYPPMHSEFFQVHDPKAVHEATDSALMLCSYSSSNSVWVVGKGKAISLGGPGYVMDFNSFLSLCQCFTWKTESDTRAVQPVHSPATFDIPVGFHDILRSESTDNFFLNHDITMASPPCVQGDMKRRQNTLTRLHPMRRFLKSVSSRLIGNFFKVYPVDLSPDDVIIIVMGLTGTGKSSFINTLIGGVSGFGKPLDECTDIVHVTKFQHLERSTHDLAFVDTPGFDDMNKSDDEIAGMINHWLITNLRKGKLQPAGILYMHCITDNRITQSSKRSLGRLKAQFGDENIIFVTTMWDETRLDEAEMLKREKALKAHWKDVIKRDPMVVRYYNNEHSAWKVIDSIIETRNEKFNKDLRTELHDMGRRLSITKAGRNAYTELEKLVSSQQSSLNELRSCLKIQGVEKSKITRLKNEYEERRLDSEDMVRFLGEVVTVPKHLQRFSTMKSGTTIV